MAAGAAGFGSLAAGPLGARDKTRHIGFQSSCVLTPEMNPGPNWRPVIIQRRRITEGLPGMPLTVYLKVVRLSDCQPVSGLTLDFWQADHQGVYSAVAAQGTVGLTFLRGFQTTPANGIVRFDTIYPGWYPGRTTHLHVKAFQGTTVVFDTQLYLPEGVTDAVYRTAPYAAFGPKDTPNKNDPFYLQETTLPARLWRSSRLGVAPAGAPDRVVAGMTLVLDL